MPTMRDDATPVLVGVAQCAERNADPAAGIGREPLQLMIDAARAAAADAGSAKLLAAADSVRIVRGLWPYANPARVVAEAVGCAGAETGISTWGGDAVQRVLTESALDIQRGAHRIILLAGAECGRSQAKARRAGVALDWRAAPGTPDRTFGAELSMRHRFEVQRGIRDPVQMYPMFESAIRHARGETPEMHLSRISTLWEGFSRVAAGNPHAWLREPVSAERIRTPGRGNRRVSLPYTKLMNANSSVDQGAALILCSVAAARRFGIDERKWVYPWAATAASDTAAVSHRGDLARSPAMRIAGERCLELAGLSIDAIDHADIYSCFPCAVQIGAAELGLGEARPLTVTGGLTFAGGPLNNYVMHAVARMSDVLRDRPGVVGLVTSNGGFLTKHAFGIYCAVSPPAPFRCAVPQAEVDAAPKRALAADFAGAATIEAYTVMYGADGPEAGLAACRLDDGRRTWGNTRDAELMAAMTREEFCGRRVRLRESGALEAV